MNTVHLVKKGLSALNNKVFMTKSVENNGLLIQRYS